MTTKPLQIAIAGLGTVGAGTVRILQQNSDIIQSRCGREIQLVAVSSRDKGKNRGVELGAIEWKENPLELISLPNIDVIIELIGGAEGIARELVESALKAGKHVVTANKALIAKHGLELAALAEQHNVMLAYEAAVAGGIPIIKSLREGLVANRFHKVVGILNGTCNFILTSMWKEHKDFHTVLKEAQAIGYAEADPSFDIDGIDTAHKTAIITSLAYGTSINSDAVYVEGIRHITPADMEFADKFGYVIKLLGISTQNEQGIMQRVHPCMIPKDSTLGRVSNAYNGIIVEGNAVGRITLEGAGAGAGATASSVVGDIVDIARGVVYKPFTLPVRQLAKVHFSTLDSLESAYYLRLTVEDKAGVLAAITAIFRDVDISVSGFVQQDDDSDVNHKQIVITTHETRESSMQNALKLINRLDFVIEPVNMIRIEAI